MYDAAVSINEVVDKKISATIYPNPTTQDAMLEMTLDKAATLSVQLTDMQGRVLYKTENRQYAAGKHSATLPTRALAAGTYFYSVSDAHGALLQSGKLVKE